MNSDHVRPDMQKYINAEASFRIAAIHQEIWVDNKSSEAVYRAMNNIRAVPDRLSAPALLVVGPGGSGKTAIISRIRDRVEGSEGLVFLSMAESPEISIKKNLRTELALALGLPPPLDSRSKKGSEIPSEIREVLRLRRIWGLVIDEFHDVLLRPKQEQRSNMSILKKLLGSEYGLKLFCFGTVSARNAMQSNDEFRRRFHEINLGDWVEDEEFRAFLLEVEESLPLRNPSRLYSEEMVKTILSISNGRMDKTLELIRSAACYAVKSGAEQVDPEMLRRANRNIWGY